MRALLAALIVLPLVSGCISASTAELVANPPVGPASGGSPGEHHTVSSNAGGMVVVPVLYNQNEFSIAANPLDPLNLVAVSNDYETLSVWTRFYTTFDGGGTWSHGRFPLLSGYKYAFDPSVTFDKRGHAYFAGVVSNDVYPETGPNAVFVGTSTDGGLTWNTRLVATDDGDLLDKPYITADPVSGALYLVFLQHDIWFMKSTDAGLTWSPRVLVGVGGAFPLPVAGLKGEIYVASIHHEDGRFAKSADGGATWTETTPLPNLGLGPGFNVPMQKSVYPVMAVARGGPHVGRIYLAGPQALVASDLASAGPSDMVVIHSDDGGVTWSPPDRIVRPGVQFMPWMAIMPDGTVGIAFMDTVLSPWTHAPPPTGAGPTESYTLISQSISIRRPDDEGWSTVMTTDEPSFAGESKFWGDYQGLAATSVGFHPAFSYAEPDINMCGCWNQARLDFATTMVAP